MDKENVRHIEYMHICVCNNGILVIHEKGNPATCDNIGYKGLMLSEISRYGAGKTGQPLVKE